MPFVSPLTTRADPLNDGRQSARALDVRRGVMRWLATHAFTALPELTLANGRRADLIAVGPKSEIWIVEIKSSLADLAADHKWPDYRPFCDRLFFATLPDVPPDPFPDAAGFLVADGFAAELMREAPEHRLAAPMRKTLVLAIARVATERLAFLADPMASGARG